MKAFLSKLVGIYLLSCYLFFTGFLLMHIDFQHGLIFGDMGISFLQFLGFVFLSPYYVVQIGIQLPSALYWLSFLVVFGICWIGFLRVFKRNAPLP